MKKNILITTLIILIVSIALELPDTVLSYWDEIHRNRQVKVATQNFDDTKTTEDIHVGKPILVDESMDVLDLPGKIDSWNLLEEDSRWYFTDDVAKRPLFYGGHDVSFTGLSPSHKKLGFFFNPEDHSLDESVLAVLDIDKRVVKEVYRGDTWTSNWEWKGDNSVIVKRSCGTGCMNAYVVDIDTGKKIDSYRVY